MTRVERADALGWVTVPLVEKANARRAACRTLGEIAMQQDLVRYCIPQDLATVLWAQARMSVLNRPLVNAVLERALHPVTLRKARARDLATMLWALGQLSVRDGKAVQEMARALVMGLQAERGTSEMRRQLKYTESLSNLLFTLAQQAERVRNPRERERRREMVASEL